MIEEIMRTQIRQTQDRRLLKTLHHMMRTMLANHAKAVENELRGCRKHQDDIRMGLIKLNSRVCQLEKLERK